MRNEDKPEAKKLIINAASSDENRPHPPVMTDGPNTAASNSSTCALTGAISTSRAKMPVFREKGGTLSDTNVMT